MSGRVSVEALEALARADYDRVVGCVLAVRTVQGYVGSDSVEMYLDEPALVRVGHADRRHDLRRWCDDYLDPTWPVSLVRPHPLLTDVRSLYLYATSYCLDGTVQPHAYLLTECPHCDVEDGRHAARCPLAGGAP